MERKTHRSATKSPISKQSGMDANQAVLLGIPCVDLYHLGQKGSKTWAFPAFLGLLRVSPFYLRTSGLGINFGTPEFIEISLNNAQAMRHFPNCLRNNWKSQASTTRSFREGLCKFCKCHWCTVTKNCRATTRKLLCMGPAIRTSCAANQPLLPGPPPYSVNTYFRAIIACMAVSVILVSLTSFHRYICLVPTASSLKIHCTT